MSRLCWGKRKLYLTQVRKYLQGDSEQCRRITHTHRLSPTDFLLCDTNSMRNGSTVAWTISMTMTRSTPDQLIKIIVAALKLQQRGTCGMWQVQNWRASTRDATCECYTNYRQIMWQTRCFPDFPQQQPCQRNLSRANNKRNSSGAGREGQREGGCSSSLCRPSTSAA